MSLDEQRAAIKRFAAQHDLRIVRWFEELQTAAKRGRPAFQEMLRLLQRGKAHGVVMHKIDRGARNLRDWADLGTLIDQGIQVHFANEGLDLSSRGGRLSADIQAVVAADFIRNLREEVKKGLYGRLKQGLYPLGAPIGYTNEGGGKRKEIDPVSGPLVRQAFELYATGDYPVERLAAEMERRGLRTRFGTPPNRSTMAKVLTNPFYVGVMRIKRTGETYPGVHEPIVTKALFDQVQLVRAGRLVRGPARHDFLFRKLIRCVQCGYALIAERQKGRVYYRCHTSGCPSTTIRGDRLHERLRGELEPLRFHPDSFEYLNGKLEEGQEGAAENRAEAVRGLELRAKTLETRLGRLTDALLDGVVDKEAYNRRREALLLDQVAIREARERMENGPPWVDTVRRYLELANTALLTLERRIPAEVREMLGTVTSNFGLSGKELVVELDLPFQHIAKRHRVYTGGRPRAQPRTLDRLLDRVLEVGRKRTLGCPQCPQ